MSTSHFEEEPSKKRRDVRFELALSSCWGNIFKFVIDGVPFEHVGSVNEANHFILFNTRNGYLCEDDRFELSQKVSQAEFTYLDIKASPRQFQELLGRFRQKEYARSRTRTADKESARTDVVFPDNKPDYRAEAGTPTLS